MQRDQDWERMRGLRADRAVPRVSPVRVALLFGTAAIAVALFATSYLAGNGRSLYADAVQPMGLDMMSTGAIPSGGGYTIRRSVLQNSPNSVCIILEDGTRKGEC